MRFLQARTALLVLLVLALASGMVGATGATFNATNSGDGKIGAQALNGPGGTLSAADSDNNVNLSWSGATAASPANGYSVYQAPAGGSSCTGISSYPTFIGSTASTGSALTDSATVNSGGTSNNAGNWYCYELVTGYWASGAGSGQAIWQSQVNNVSTPIQAGFLSDVVRLPLFGTGNTATVAYTGFSSATAASWLIPTGAITTSTVFKFFWSSAQTPVAYSGDVCPNNNTGVVSFGDSGTGASCNLSATTPLGPLSPGPGGGTITAGGKKDRMAASFTWAAGNTELDVAITSTNGLSDSVNAGTSSCAVTHCPSDSDWIFNPHALALNDIIKVTFASAVPNPQAYSNAICFASANQTIYVSLTGTCGTSAGYQVAKLTGGLFTDGAANAGVSASYAWSAGNTVLTATVTNLNGNTVNIASSWTATLATSFVTQNSTTFTFHVNQAAGTGVGQTPNGNLCIDGTGKKIWFGDSNLSGACAANATQPLGYLDGSASGTITAGASDRQLISYAWTNSQLLTVTITNNLGFSDTIGGTWVFHPADNNANPGGNSIVTADATVTLCTANAGCQPSTS